jgi:hypothetical protein
MIAGTATGRQARRVKQSLRQGGVGIEGSQLDRRAKKLVC